MSTNDISHQPPVVAQPAAARPAQQSSDHLALAFIPLTGGLIGLFGPHKNDPIVRFQAFHALFTSAAGLALHALLGIFGGSFLLLQAALDVTLLGFTLAQAYRTYQGTPWQLPVISDLARKQSEPSGDSVNKQQ